MFSAGGHSPGNCPHERGDSLWRLSCHLTMRLAQYRTSGLNAAEPAVSSIESFLETRAFHAWAFLRATESLRCELIEGDSFLSFL